jgi:hypothetical protein
LDGFAGLVNGTLPPAPPRHWTGWRLRPDHKIYIAGLAALYGPLLSNATVLGFNLGDELYAKGLPHSNLSACARAMRAAFPRGSAILWYNEDSGAPTKKGYRVPPEMDWFSIDLYDMSMRRGPGWVNNSTTTQLCNLTIVVSSAASMPRVQQSPGGPFSQKVVRILLDGSRWKSVEVLTSEAVHIF